MPLALGRIPLLRSVTAPAPVLQQLRLRPLPRLHHASQPARTPSMSAGTLPAAGTSRDVDTWSDAELRAAVRRYGFRGGRSRTALLEQLQAVHAALSAQSIDVGFDVLGTEATHARAELAQGTDADPIVLSDEDVPLSAALAYRDSDTESEAEAGDLTRQLEAEARDSSSPSSSDEPLAHTLDPGTSTIGVSADLPLHALAPALVADTPLWTRILRFEPVPFDEVVSTLHCAGIPVSSGRKKEQLRAWLDNQGVCFFTAELTGPRARH